VFVCGEVAVPGVYELASDSRIYQAVEAAGGLTEAAAGDYVNQAELVADSREYVTYTGYLDGVKVSVKGCPSPAIAYEQGKVKGQSASDGRVNLNTAGKEELMTLTGIGEKKAEAIIQYRDVSGGFGSIEELMQVEGIKEGTFEKIKEDIVI
jgi:competence protein ComEA